MWYYLFYFYQNRRTPPIVGRNPVLVYGIVLFSKKWVKQKIRFPMSAQLFLNTKKKQKQKTLVVFCYFYNWSDKWLKIIFLLRYVMTSAVQPAVTLMVARFYLGYYRVRLAVHSLRDEWKHLINPEAANQTWIIKYRHTLGNARFIENRVAFPICAVEAVVTGLSVVKLCMCIAILIDVNYQNIHFDFFFLLWLWKSLPVYRDVFNVRSEILAVFAVLMLIIITFLVLSSIGSLNNTSGLWWLNPLLLC
ncbi:hypothetical protein RFI_12717 [Reticulomyxa filosa]|uniref:Uncharacterized protein n=1 Tax=Reticulomyxa filosa TaxID=46433 RepID=X6NFD3_RETFI|nr:hypothetical protein RFI_12717 [Reticulomyxa filosa]|eukprot:ETO24439.1 hypothetical protein RFI_12717 [Reticulomyxa filosa]